MKLLFDEQLSPVLVARLTAVYPGSAHVHALGLGGCDDRVVWDYARDHGYDVVTKDADFADLVMTLGAPPRVVWLRLGNCATSAVEALLIEHREAVIAFGQDLEARVLALANGGSGA